MGVIYYKCLLPLLVCGKDIKNFVAFSITNLEHMFHLEYINFEVWLHNWHEYHAAKGVCSSEPWPWDEFYATLTP